MIVHRTFTVHIPSGSLEHIEQTLPPLNLQKNNRFTFPNLWLANIRGGFCNKIDEIATVLTANHIDIAFVMESWLHTGTGKFTSLHLMMMVVVVVNKGATAAAAAAAAGGGV